MRRILNVMTILWALASLKALPERPEAAGETMPAAATTSESSTPEPGRPQVADFTARDLDGVAFSFHELLAKGPVLVDFWALWCRPCLKELPELDRVAREFKDRGFQVLAVNTDAPADMPKVKPFVRSRKFAFRVVLDVDGNLRRRFQVNAFPTAVLVAPDGRTLWSNQGYRPGDEKKLAEALNSYFHSAPDSSGVVTPGRRR